jgi:guanylate kinase
MDSTGRPSTDPTFAGRSGRSGCLFILSAPSGAGKTTLCHRLRRRFEDLAYSVSTTTRQPRAGERQGREYHFVNRTDFEEGIAEGRWAEWAQVHGNYYGTNALWIDRTLQAGADILLDIDVQGARQIVERFPDAITIFIMAPSLEELERRLRLRGTDAADTIMLRLANARREISQKDRYRHVVVNDDLERAAAELIGIVEQYRKR